MANSSPSRARGPAILSSPAAMPALSEYMYESRNSPEIHKFKQIEAEKSTLRVQQAAIHALELYELKVATLQLEAEERRKEEQEKERKEQEAKRKEAALAEEKRAEEAKRAAEQRAADQARLEKLRAESIPKPTPPPSAPAAPSPPTQPTINGVKPAPAIASTPAQPPAAANPAQPAQYTQPQPAVAPPTVQAKSLVPTTDRYIEVHKQLKELRKFTMEHAKTNPAVKQNMGDMRRKIQKSFGQITMGGLKTNKLPLQHIVENLRRALDERQLPSARIKVQSLVLHPREPMEGARHNEEELPCLFLYLMNSLAKSVIKQFINESGADTTKADGVGQFVAKIFSEPEFQWRGKSLIDFMQAKLRVVCPVLFGYSGNDRTVAGRAAVGWKKGVTEDEHCLSQTGLAAGFAAMTLRDFSKAKGKTNPWPPRAYWTAMATIVNTPTEQLSDTACVVLKAMIENFEEMFIKMYGTAAVAALRTALVDFPSRFPNPSPHVAALKVHAKSLATSTGLPVMAM